MATENITTEHGIPPEVDLLPEDLRDAHADGVNARLRAQSRNTPSEQAADPAKRKFEVTDAEEYQALMCQLHQTVHFCDDTARLLSGDFGPNEGQLGDDYRVQMTEISSRVISRQYSLLERLGDLGEPFWFGDLPTISALDFPEYGQRMHDYLMERKE